MRYTLLVVCALSIACPSVQCMSEQQRLIQPPSYSAPPPSASRDVERGNINRGVPQENDIYTGTMYGAGTTTYGQFWQAHKIPEEERYRSGPQLDEYVERYRGRQTALCCCRACCVLCSAGAVAGCITGLVYCCQAIEDSYDDDWNRPDFPGNNTLASIAALIKKME